MRENFDFKEVVELINHAPSVEIDPDPIIQKKGAWSLFGGRYIIHGESISFKILYLNSKATNSDLADAKQKGLDLEKTRIVYPVSLSPRAENIKRIFRGAKNFQTTKDFLISFIGEELKTYTEKLIRIKPNFYIHPEIEVPRGIGRKMPNPVHNALVDGLDTDELFVLLAEPGQGKTYMCDYIASAIAERQPGLFPIYVGSEQWASMGPAEIGSLWKTITHSFRYMEAPIGWVAGCEEEFIHVMLKAGVFCIIFDGFDEYVLKNNGNIGSIETIKILSDLVRDTSAKVLVTSRTSFWETEIEALIDYYRESNEFNFRRFRIKPFDPNSAERYFKDRLANEDRAKSAKRFYEELFRIDREFIGRGFTLSLIADLFSEESEVNIEAVREGESPLMWLMNALCTRDTRRHNLQMNGKEQVECLSIFAAEQLQGEKADDDLLDFCIEQINPKLSQDARRNCIRNMRSHPLVNFRAEKTLWEFTQKQVNVFLVAYYLINADRDELEVFARKARFSDDFSSDLALAIVSLKPDERDIKKIISMFLNSTDIVGSPLRRLAVQVAMRVVDNPKSKKDKGERTKTFLSLFAENESHPRTLRKLPFSGGVAKFDFRDIRFVDCVFERVRWGNCIFDSTTRFESCEFIGSGSANHCKGLGKARWNNCSFDKESRAAINNLQARDGAKAYTEDHLREDIDCVLRKFIVSGGGFKRVNGHHINSGHISTSKHRKEIIQVLSEHVIEFVKGNGSAQRDYYKVRDEAVEAMRFYSINNLYTSCIKTAYKRLCRDLCDDN